MPDTESYCVEHILVEQPAVTAAQKLDAKLYPLVEQVGCRATRKATE